MFVSRGSSPPAVTMESRTFPRTAAGPKRSRCNEEEVEARPVGVSMALAMFLRIALLQVEEGGACVLNPLLPAGDGSASLFGCRCTANLVRLAVSLPFLLQPLNLMHSLRQLPSATRSDTCWKHSPTTPWPYPFRQPDVVSGRCHRFRLGEAWQQADCGSVFEPLPIPPSNTAFYCATSRSSWSQKFSFLMTTRVEARCNRWLTVRGVPDCSCSLGDSPWRSRYQ